MKKKLKIILLIIIIIIAITTIIIGLNHFSNHKYENNTVKLCETIKNYQNTKESFVIYVEQTNSVDNFSEEIDRLLTEYTDLKLIKTSQSSIAVECFEKTLNNKEQYQLITTDNANSILVYINGVFSTIYGNVTDYYSLIDILNDSKIIRKHEINETTSFEEFKTNINNQYILVLISDEKHRKMIEENAKKYFTNVNYDIVDFRSKVGSKINDYINDNYETGIIYPKALYFKDSKLLKENEILDLEDDYIAFIDYINNH